jgi:hypothetical protein
MKKMFFSVMLIFLIIPFSLHAQNDKESLKVVKDTIAVDSTEYELIVLDPGFETWLLSKPMNMYSETYYKIKNRMYVSEWNNRYMNPVGNQNIYESYIDYKPDVDYGLEFNYRLYFYFKYFEEVNHVSLLPGIKGR